MKNFCLLIFFFIVVNCNKHQSVLICGDHVCINDKEARQFFEKNLSIEVKIINKKRDKIQDLVELNLKENSSDSKEVYLKQKTQTNKKLKEFPKKDK